MNFVTCPLPHFSLLKQKFNDHMILVIFISKIPVKRSHISVAKLTVDLELELVFVPSLSLEISGNWGAEGERRLRSSTLCIFWFQVGFCK